MVNNGQSPSLVDIHGVRLGELASKIDKIRYACDQVPDPPTTDAVRTWLSDYGVSTTRSYASSVVNAWRRDRGLAPAEPTGELPELSSEAVAQLDAEVGHPDTVQPTEPDVYEHRPDPAEARPAVFGRTRLTRAMIGTLLTLVGVLLAGVIIAPIALSSQDIIRWAGSSGGLGLADPWPIVVFLALDAAAAVCVGIVVYCAWRGESAGVFSWLVWVFAGTSAFANYRYGTRPDAAADAWWFFPAMSLAGPFLLEVTIRRVRKWVQEGTGRRARHGVSFGVARWIPGVGAARETYCAWRLARLDGIDDADAAVRAYRELCPDGSLRVLRALRERARTRPNSQRQSGLCKT